MSAPTPDDIVDDLVPFAARLVGTVHDDDPAVTGDLLRQIPGGRVDALLVVLAAMVPVDRTPSELLAWVEDYQLLHAGRQRPVECGTPAGYDKHCRERTEKCTPCRSAHASKRARDRADRRARDAEAAARARTQARTAGAA